MKRIALFSIIVSILYGCFAVHPATTPTKQTFTFEYTPKETNKAGSANMVLAFISPSFAKNFVGNEMFQRFQSSLEGDIGELINAKGFNVRGPFATVDEMMFEDKQRTDLIIYIEIAPHFTAPDGGWKTNFSLMGTSGSTYSYAGTASLVGKINILGVEPLTNEKIWSKSVSIPNIENIAIQTTYRYNNTLNSQQLMNDPGVYNALGKALESQYAGILDKIAAHFNVAELNSMKPEIKELKARKGY